jgi:hypothetical protein
MRDESLIVHVDRWGILPVEGKYLGTKHILEVTFHSCKRLGWIERCAAPDDVQSYYREDGETSYFAKISAEGQRAIEGLPDEAFVSVKKPSSRGITARILRALTARHQQPEWVFFAEVGGIDAIAVNCFHSEKYRWVGYEVKANRGDFLREIKKNGHKTARNAATCNEFYFVVPSGMVAKEEVPDPYGLMNVGSKGGCRIAKRALFVDRTPERWMIAALLRAVYRHEMEERSP